MKNKFLVCALLGMIALSSWFTAYVILSQSKQINQLEEQLHWFIRFISKYVTCNGGRPVSSTNGRG